MQPLEVRTINQWSVDKYEDSQLALLIELYRGIAQDYCNGIFTEGYEPMGVKKFIADSIKHCENSGIASQSMGTVSISFTQDLPETLYKSIEPYKKLRW